MSDARATGGRFQRVLAVLGLAWTSLAVAFVASEVLLRLSAPKVDPAADPAKERGTAGERGAESSGMFQAHPYLGYQLVPGFVSQTPRFKNNDDTFRVSINSLGFRGPEIEREKPDDVYRIVCVGGSTTFCTGATDDLKAYPAQLERILNRKAESDLRFEVINAGCSGYTTAESLVNFALRLVDLEPDARVIYHAPNDARVAQCEGFVSDYTHFRRSWVSRGESGLERSLLGRSRVVQRLTGDESGPVQRLQDYVFVEDFGQLHVPASERLVEGGLAAYERNLRSLVALARSHDVEVVLQTFAFCAERESEEQNFGAMVQAMNVRLGELAEELQVPLFRAAKLLEGRCELYTDWMHYNDEGCERHAAGLANWAMRQGQFGIGA